MSKQAEKLTYETAMTELEEIRGALESNEVPIDILAEKVKRASFLVKYCQDMLRGVETEVGEILKGKNG
jgi:exodeoxyribonuclease VII small subunit